MYHLLIFTAIFQLYVRRKNGHTFFCRLVNIWVLLLVINVLQSLFLLSNMKVIKISLTKLRLLLQTWLLASMTNVILIKFLKCVLFCFFWQFLFLLYQPLLIFLLNFLNKFKILFLCFENVTNNLLKLYLVKVSRKF